MKKRMFLQGIATALLCLVMAVPALAADQEEITRRLQGTWYDVQDPAITLQVDGDMLTGGTIGKAPIETIYNVAGGDATFGAGLMLGTGRSQELKEVRFGAVNLTRNGSRKHTYLFLDGAVSRTPREPYYNESVQGIYLGMAQKDAAEVLGGPGKQVPQKYPGTYPEYEYRGLGIRFTVQDGMIISITLFNPDGRTCPSHFENSGLNCNDPLSAYAAKYGLQDAAADHANAIGGREYLWFNMDGSNTVTLSLQGDGEEDGESLPAAVG